MGDTTRDIDNDSLIRASRMVVSHGSTTLVESLLLGVPSVFYKRDFDDAFMEATMRSVGESHLPRLRDAAQLRDAFASALRTGNGTRTMPPKHTSRSDTSIEGHVGAAMKQWELLASFLEN